MTRLARRAGRRLTATVRDPPPADDAHRAHAVGLEERSRVDPLRARAYRWQGSPRIADER